ncbi:E3 ubiquitin-protein ligase RNF212B isoform X2 [Gasterosteus aculeatus]|uniref:RING finger protein 212B-like isoform X2 n=1 Tax=Gasterosteus aculeatus aculeatus TaxID=481459 RepID=UPI001A995170|nr:RING finger protein 212B-like isoform X2 [Gasterosteus aculeatus aculeatus]
MDWLHCNQCFTRRGSRFAVSSCGHICCDACIKSKQCSVCGVGCSYLHITDEMKPQEKVFFEDPTKLIQSRLERISQIAVFQRTQTERVTAHFRHKSVELERRLKEVTEQSFRQLSELKRENAVLKKQLLELKRETDDLKKPLSQRRVSPGQFHTNRTQRMSLPVAVTSPATLAQKSLAGWPETGVAVPPPSQLLDQFPLFRATVLFMNMYTEHPRPSALL